MKTMHISKNMEKRTHQRCDVKGNKGDVKGNETIRNDRTGQGEDVGLNN